MVFADVIVAVGLSVWFFLVCTHEVLEGEWVQDVVLEILFGIVVEFCVGFLCWSERDDNFLMVLWIVCLPEGYHLFDPVLVVRNAFDRVAVRIIKRILMMGQSLE